jgi:hypothetical protein
MKKLILLVAILVGGTLSAQTMNSLKEAASSTTESKMSSDSMITQLAGDQVKSLTKKFNLSDAQAEQVSGLVTSYLKSPKFEKMLSKYSPDKLLGGSGTSMIQQALLSDNNFMKDMKGIASEEQLTKMGANAMKKKG